MSSVFYCVGDSHASVFSGNKEIVENYPVPHENHHPMFKGFRLGAPTAYNFYEKKMEEIKSIIEEYKPDKDLDFIVPVAGEIDCRCHIVKQYKLQGKEPVEVIDDCLERFFKSHLEIRSWGYKVCAWAVSPPSSYNYPDEPENCWSHVGSFEERKFVTKIFNEKMKEKCDNLKIPFVSIYEKLVNSFEFSQTYKILISKFYRDEIHLGIQTLPLIEQEFRKLL